MKLFILFALMLLGIKNMSLNAQATCDCLTNYQFVYHQLVSSKSYHTSSKQLKLKIDSVYNETQKRIDQNGQNSVFECFSMVAQIVMLVNDNHNSFETKYYPIEMSSWSDEAIMTEFKESPEYNLFPFYTNDLDSLYHESLKKDFHDIEGVYVFGNHTKLVLIEESGMVNGYVFETILKPWNKGELMLRLIPHTDGRYKLLFGNPVNKKLIYNFEKFQAGFLMQLKIKKIDVLHEPYHQEAFEKETYLLEQINDTVQYLKIGSFKSSKEVITKAMHFCDSIRSQLNSSILIVDVRGNTGGYKTNARHFNKLLKAFRGKIVFLVNFRTKSYAEIFTLKWKGKAGVTIAGMNTAGVIAFGRNHPDKKVSEDGWLLTHFTDMGGLRYKKYENVGVTPDVYFDVSKDWIDQAIKIHNH